MDGEGDIREDRRGSSFGLDLNSDSRLSKDSGGDGDNEVVNVLVGLIVDVEEDFSRCCWEGYKEGYLGNVSVGMLVIVDL